MMSEKRIALGFHACVDYELEWDSAVIEQLIRQYGISARELRPDIRIATVRDLLTVILYHMRQGTGCEVMPESQEVCSAFAAYFTYKVTIGGTAARAAIAIHRIGYESTLAMCCFNHHIRDKLPQSVEGYPGVGMEHNEVYPHIILQYPSGIRIRVNGIDFVTHRPNRILISRDTDSMNMVIPESYKEKIKDADVFLLSCFSEVLDGSILRARLDTVSLILKSMKKGAAVIMEDGCYVNPEHRYYVHRRLAPVLSAVSMNEDEFQDYVGYEMDMYDGTAVAQAVLQAYWSLKVPVLIIHTYAWALAYGNNAVRFEASLKSGIMLASARYIHGDHFGEREYRQVEQIRDNRKGEIFCRDMREQCPLAVCVPCKDLTFVNRPTTVGLGDYFAGGLLPGLTEGARR